MNNKIATNHIEDHFDRGNGLTRAKGISETFKPDITQNSLLSEINQRLDDLNNVVSTGVSKKGHYELILDMGRPINMNESTNTIEIWIDPVERKISSIHPKN